MVNQKLSQFNSAISQSKGIHKLFTTGILLVAIAYPSSFTEASQLNENHFNNASEQQSLEPEINPVGEQPLVIAQRYNRRPRVRQRIIIGPRRSRVRPVYRPVRRYRVRPVRGYNRYRGQRVYVR